MSAESASLTMLMTAVSVVLAIGGRATTHSLHTGVPASFPPLSLSGRDLVAGVGSTDVLDYLHSYHPTGSLHVWTCSGIQVALSNSVCAWRRADS